MLVDAGADVHVKGDSETALTMAIENGHSNVAVLLVQAGHDVKFKHQVDIEKLGRDLSGTRAYDDEQGLTALMAAVGQGDTDLAKALMEKGANPEEAEAPAFKERDGKPRTALSLAKTKADPGMLKMLRHVAEP